jgi:hypothetical protein
MRHEFTSVVCAQYPVALGGSASHARLIRGLILKNRFNREIHPQVNPGDDVRRLVAGEAGASEGEDE